MTLYDVPAPAKLNLFLHVVGRRADGYHLLQTAFRFIGLCDTLNFEKRSDGRILCDGQIEGLAAEDDLVVRAARALQQATGTPYGAQISYEKKIPAGGGLGGGSSDAASTLIALNRLWQTNLGRSDLMKLALPLGADVPVFIFGQPAFAQGIGEQLSPLSVPERAYFIAQPSQNVPTTGIFSSPDLTRDSACIKISVFADWLKIATPLNAHDSTRETNACTTYFGRNDLEPVVFAKYPKVQQAGTWLMRQGVNARMTGSGACFFAEFVTLEQALLCQREIIGKIAYCENGSAAVIKNTWACPGLIDHPLRHWVHS